jgi:poly(ADP-ribose) glycohydrolase
MDDCSIPTKKARKTSPPPSTSETSRQLKITELYHFKNNSSKTLPEEEMEDTSSLGTEEHKDDDKLSHVSESPPATPTPVLVTSCLPLKDISFGPSCLPLLPPLKSSPFHCVMIRTEMGKPFPLPYPSSFKDVWDENHVRMPCSSQCQYPVGPSKVEKKWQLIAESLRKPITNSFELEKTILSYNTRFATKWTFKLLHSYFNEFVSSEEAGRFFATTLPQLISLTLDLPNIVTHGIPLLQKQQDYSITMSQQQIACLLANAFFCTYPRRNSTAPSAEYFKFPGINFHTLFCSNTSHRMLNKLKCILHYFERVLTKPPSGAVTFTRQVCTSPPVWDQRMDHLTNLHVTSIGTIEDDGHSMLQVDFANKYVGGGVLGQGCVQEEIRFLVCPELIISKLFTEELDDNETLLILGAERYSSYHGYRDTFTWGGDYHDDTLSDEWGRKQVHIVAADALIFRRKLVQYSPRPMLRELNKAYSGFMNEGWDTPSKKPTAVATGKWGCGAFGGEPHLKALLQWMACSVAKRDMVYFTFDEVKLVKELNEYHSLLTFHNVTVGKLWLMLKNYHKDVIEKKSRLSLLHYLSAQLTR